MLLLGLVVFVEPFNFNFFRITGWGIHLDYHDIEWFALEMNRDHSVVSEIVSKYCISDFLLTMMVTPFLLRLLPFLPFFFISTLADIMG